ncbi:hypothetical protein L2E82_27446 [Cichorium intybus]|uniref:Uncharacterized protein n=1 Tax=Cichorium intybus TaxID=13427 RepID=A0ACB9CTE0_CICIN|nr:hypothetical protein L2E82_27446 [Cichorium intybus]
MEEGDRGGSSGASSSSSSVSLYGGGRQRSEVELKPGETTIVLWKKLMKDANKAASNSLRPHIPAPPMPHKVKNMVHKGEEVVIVTYLLHLHEKLAIAVLKAMRGHSLQETKKDGRFHVHTKMYLDGALLKELSVVHPSMACKTLKAVIPQVNTSS